VRPLAGPLLGRGRAICARAAFAAPRTCPSSQRCLNPHLPSARRLPRPSDATDASPPSDRRQRVTDDVVGDTARVSLRRSSLTPVAGGPVAAGEAQVPRRTSSCSGGEGGRAPRRGATGDARRGEGEAPPRRGGSSARRVCHADAGPRSDVGLRSARRGTAVEIVLLLVLVLVVIVVLGQSRWRSSVVFS